LGMDHHWKKAPATAEFQGLAASLCVSGFPWPLSRSVAFW
jgi:hypothetical protein